MNCRYLRRQLMWSDSVICLNLSAFVETVLKEIQVNLRTMLTNPYKNNKMFTIIIVIFVASTIFSLGKQKNLFKFFLTYYYDKKLYDFILILKLSLLLLTLLFLFVMIVIKVIIFIIHSDSTILFLTLLFMYRFISVHGIMEE